jgi:uncharacterized protein HemX
MNRERHPIGIDHRGVTMNCHPERSRADRARRDKAGDAPHRRDEGGEGVISTAIAVLIVAFLGIALWTGFDAMMDDATDRTRAQVEQIGG